MGWFLAVLGRLYLSPSPQNRTTDLGNNRSARLKSFNCVQSAVVLRPPARLPAAGAESWLREELSDLALMLERIDAGAGERGLVIPTNQ